MPTRTAIPASPAAATPAVARAQADTAAPAVLPHALEVWLCALLTALLGRLAPIAHLVPRSMCYSIEAGEPLSAEARRAVRAAIRAANRLRAWIGWILRFAPNRGPARTFARATPQLRALSARAPPHAASTPQNPFQKPRFRRR